MTVIESLGMAPKAKQFLATSPIKSYIGGKWIGSADGKTLTALDPGSGEPIAEFYVMQPSDVNRAVQAAGESFRKSGWGTFSPEERGVYLQRLADLIERDLDALGDIEALDGGKLRSAGLGDAQCVADRLRFYADTAVRARYEATVSVPHYVARMVRLPYGVCAFIVPWNYPLGLMAWGICPALAAGNTVVVKPASDTSLSALYVAQLAEEAGIPAGVLNVVAGPAEPTGMALARHPDIKRLSLTGSPEAGKSVAVACAQNLVPVKLELGGKGAAVVFDDVNVDLVADRLAEAITSHVGQICCNATRWIIQDGIYDRFATAVSARLNAVRIGHGFDPQTQMGPVINAKQRERVLSYIQSSQAEGAQALVPGGVCSVPGYEGGFYVKPALLAGSLDNVAAREEIFGPVAYMARFGSEDEAVEMVNNTRYGLANSVWSRDPERCDRMALRMVAGNSWINAHNIIPLGVPYAGINQSGMGGGVNSPDTLYDYMRNLTITQRG